MAKLSDLLKSRKAGKEPDSKPAEKPKKTAKRKRTGRPTNHELVAAGKRPSDLITPTQAIAAELYLRGNTKIDAYQKAMNCSRDVAAAASSRMFDMPAVRDYIGQRMEARKQQNKLTEQRVLEEWIDLLNTALPDVLENGGSGEIRIKSFDAMTDAEKRSIKKMKVKQRVIVRVGDKKNKDEKDGEPQENVEVLQLVEQEISVEMYSRADILRNVGEHLGMFAEQEEAKARGVTSAIFDRIQKIKEERRKELDGRIINGEVVSK